MKIIVYDTETTGLIKNKKCSPENTEYFPYIVQFSWLIYDDKTGKITTKNYLIKLPDTVHIPIESMRIHGITNEKMRKDGIDIKGVLNEFTSDWMKCSILVAHNINFDNKVIQAEYCRNQPINWLGRHRKIEYCTMNYGKKFTNILRKSKFYNGMYKKPPKLMELHQELFKETPGNLHDALVDVLVCFRCFHKMVYEKDIYDGIKNKEATEYFKDKCDL
jgi:DNA polymerase III subunit epsilon